MTEDSALIVQGGVSASLVALLQTAVLRMIPYAVPGLFLVILDLAYGIKAARHRGETIRLSTAVRRSMTKTFLYICWLILATTIAIAFDKEWLEWGVLGLVYGNEFLSIVGNYLEAKGLQFSIAAVYRWILKFFAGKVGGELTDDEASEILKKKQTKKHDKQ